MKRKRLSLLTAAAGVLLMLTIGVTVLAQSSANFNLGWHVIGTGGGESGSAHYRVNGTFGQHTAASPVSSSANFNVFSGYWFDSGNAVHIYLPLILRN